MLCTFRTIFVHNMFCPCSELAIFMYWTCNSINNLSSYCGLVDAKIRASDKDLPVQALLLALQQLTRNSSRKLLLHNLTILLMLLILILPQDRLLWMYQGKLFSTKNIKQIIRLFIYRYIIHRIFFLWINTVKLGNKELFDHRKIVP